jgi:hypothetical protein
METPWGPLRSLDFEDANLASKIIETDKDTLVEGLIVENTFDQILAPLSQMETAPLVVLDIETIIAATDGRRYAFVWPRSRQPGLGRYLQALQRVMTVFVVELQEGEFLATPFEQGALNRTKRQPLTDAAQQISGSRGRVRPVDLSVRDAGRLKGAFWGFLSAVYKERLWEKVLLPRLFINHGLSPYFGQVWNLDRICLYRERIWLLEIKHKFPFPSREGLRFGINEGELQNVEALHRVDIQCLHAVLVKPVWQKGASAMYLYNNRDLQQRVAVIAMNLGKASRQILGTRARVAPRHTSVGGNTEVRYYPLRPDNFSYIGSLTDSTEALGKGLCAALDGEKLPPVADSMLKTLGDHGS